MSKLNKFVVLGALALVAVAVVAPYASYAQFTPTPLTVENTATLVSDMADDIGDTIGSGIGAVLGFLAILIGLFFLWRQLVKRVGRPR